MKVIFLDNIRGVGRVGDIKDVADGYARNFLIPRGLARSATDGAVKDVESLKTKKLQSLKLQHEQAVALAQKIGELSVEVSGKANEKGTLFAAVDAAHVADAISKATGEPITSGSVHLPETLKTVGDHAVTIELAEGVTLSVIVRIVALQ